MNLVVSDMCSVPALVNSAPSIGFSTPAAPPITDHKPCAEVEKVSETSHWSLGFLVGCEHLLISKTFPLKLLLLSITYGAYLFLSVICLLLLSQIIYFL